MGVAAVHHHAGVAGEGVGGQQAAYLGQPAFDELPVEVARPGAQQGETLQAKQVRQWMLVDHAATLARGPAV